MPVSGLSHFVPFGSQLPHKTVDLLFSIIIQNNKLTVLVGELTL